MMEGFRKGKIPKRFENMSDKEIMELPHRMYKEISNSIVDDITRKISVYYDTELSAMQTIIKIKQLEKALDKACDMLRLFESGYAESEPAYALISSTLDGVECHDIKWWKEWCMKDD